MHQAENFKRNIDRTAHRREHFRPGCFDEKTVSFDQANNRV
jgi:hypothetical protein